MPVEDYLSERTLAEDLDLLELGEAEVLLEVAADPREDQFAAHWIIIYIEPLCQTQPKSLPITYSPCLVNTSLCLSNARVAGQRPPEFYF